MCQTRFAIVCGEIVRFLSFGGSLCVILQFYKVVIDADCVCLCVLCDGRALRVEGSSLEFKPLLSALLKTCQAFYIMNV